MKQRKPDRWGILKAVKGANIPKAGKIKPKASVAGKIPEKNLQAMAEHLCIQLGIRFFRIPDKLMGFLATSAPVWVRVFVAGYFQGVPDLMLFKKRPDGSNEVRFIEIKTEAGKISQGQAKWHSGLTVMVTYGWYETEQAIRSFIGEI